MKRDDGEKQDDIARRIWGLKFTFELDEVTGFLMSGAEILQALMIQSTRTWFRNLCIAPHSYRLTLSVMSIQTHTQKYLSILMLN